MTIAPHTSHRTGPGSNASQAPFHGELAERRDREGDTMPATPYAALVEAHNAARALALAPPSSMQNARNALERYARLARAFVVRAVAYVFRRSRGRFER